MEIKFWQSQRSMQARGFSITSEGLMLAGSAVLNIVLWILVLLTFPKQDPSAILHYTAGVGIDFIGTGWQIVILPSMGLIILILNAILGRVVQKVSRIAFWIFWSSMPIIEGLLIGTYLILLRFNS